MHEMVSKRSTYDPVKQGKSFSYNCRMGMQFLTFSLYFAVFRENFDQI